MPTYIQALGNSLSRCSDPSGDPKAFNIRYISTWSAWPLICPRSFSPHKHTLLSIIWLGKLCTAVTEQQILKQHSLCQIKIPSLDLPGPNVLSLSWVNFICCFPHEWPVDVVCQIQSAAATCCLPSVYTLYIWWLFPHYGHGGFSRDIFPLWYAENEIVERQSSRLLQCRGGPEFQSLRLSCLFDYWKIKTKRKERKVVIFAPRW